jgi:hypothetical protein
VNFIYAILVTVAMGAVLGLGCVLASKGSPWLLILSSIALVVAIGKIGCLPASDSHHDAH